MASAGAVKTGSGPDTAQKQQAELASQRTEQAIEKFGDVLSKHFPYEFNSKPGRNESRLAYAEHLVHLVDKHSKTTPGFTPEFLDSYLDYMASAYPGPGGKLEIEYALLVLSRGVKDPSFNPKTFVEELKQEAQAMAEFETVLTEHGFRKADAITIAETYAKYAKLGFTSEDLEKQLDIIKRVGMDPGQYLRKYLSPAMDEARSPEQMRVLLGAIEDYAKFSTSNYDFSAFVGNALPPLFQAINHEVKGQKCTADERATAVGEFLRDYIDNFGEPYGYAEKIMPAILKKTATVERLRMWDAQAKSMIKDCEDKFGKTANYALSALPNIVEKSRSLWQLKMAGEIVANYLSSENTQFFYDFAGKQVPEMLDALNTDERLKKWGEAAAPFLLDYSGHFKNMGADYVKMHIAGLLGSVKTPAQLETALGFIKDYPLAPGDNYNYTGYVGNSLPDTIKAAKSDEHLDAARGIAKDYIGRFGEPYEFVIRTLPMLMGKADSAEELRAWGDAALEFLERSGRGHSKSAQEQLQKRLGAANSPEDLRSP